MEDLLMFQGSYSMSGGATTLNQLPETGGVYLWCVESAEGIYRVHYVGEAQNIRARSWQHYSAQQSGHYHAYLPEELRRNVKVLVHRAGRGVVPRFNTTIGASAANQQYLECLSIFFAPLPVGTDKQTRCRYETAIAYAVEDHGANILAVGRLNVWRGDTVPVRIDTGDSLIEALSGQVLRV